MKEYTYVCHRGEYGRHVWEKLCKRDSVPVSPVPTDVTHLTLLPAEGGYSRDSAFGNNLFAPTISEKVHWGPYNELEVITLADGFITVGESDVGFLGFYDRRLVPYRNDMVWDAPNLQEVRLPATVFHIRQGVLDDLGAAVVVPPESPFYYNTPDGALYDRRTDALVHIPTCRAFVFSVKAVLTPARNGLRTGYPLVDESPLSALRGAVRRGLRSVVIPSESKLAIQWKIVDGVLYDRVLGAALLCLDPERKSWTAPAWCGCVVPNAFAGCHALESVTMTTPGVRLYPDAFCDCPSLQTLQLPRDAVFYRGRRYPAMDIKVDAWNGKYGYGFPEMGIPIDMEPKHNLSYKKSDEELKKMSEAERMRCERMNDILDSYERSFGLGGGSLKVPGADYVYGIWPRPVVMPVPEHSELCSLYGCVDAKYPVIAPPVPLDPLKDLKWRLKSARDKAAFAAKVKLENEKIAERLAKTPPAPEKTVPRKLLQINLENAGWFDMEPNYARKCDHVESIHIQRCTGFCIADFPNLREVKIDVLESSALQIIACPKLEKVEVLSLTLPLGERLHWPRAKDFGAMPNLKTLVLPEAFREYQTDITAHGGPVPTYSEVKPEPNPRAFLRPTPHPDPKLTGRKYINSAKFAAPHDPFAKALALSSEEQLELVLQD